ncbi:RES family NAD+ phosphorylase [Pseudoalteromonas sp. SR44-5]|uniref:RES family NAD+ phosphorylase n=1 Tax=Pseudoalteromonas sp. SR44-5 TaxID=2760934 RepID=UPI001602EE13|nr:RES family NAD+ phosphorylase [Pseudoalteromonas sp. SR44-5]MBB1368024.1 RES family NAD+ phosphorylase [Pseudoalteromonas sp. SR44-5]
MKKICTHCFKNHGLHNTAMSVSSCRKKEYCERCSNYGYDLSKSEIEEIMSSFFVVGSIPPEIGGPAPVYQYNKNEYPSEVRFLTELDDDLKILSDNLGVGLFHYGPPLWRLGYTEDYQSLVIDDVQGAERKAIFSKIINRCTEEIFDRDNVIFRVRTASKLPPALPEQFDTPPIDKMTEGRFNSKSFPIFYGASDIETCLHETRATLSDHIMMAKFITLKPLKLLNFTKTDESIAGNEFERIDILLQKLAFGGVDEYVLCQELALEIKNRGFDGLISQSYFGQAHKKKLYNISLFGYPVKDNKIGLISTNRIKIKSVEYEFTYGPINNNSKPIDKEKVMCLYKCLIG